MKRFFYAAMFLTVALSSHQAFACFPICAPEPQEPPPPPSRGAYYTCFEPNPAGNYEVSILVDDNAFGKKSALVSHSLVQQKQFSLTAVVSNCKEDVAGQKLSCSDSLRSFIIFDDLSAEYHGTGGVRYLKCQ